LLGSKARRFCRGGHKNVSHLTSQKKKERDHVWFGRFSRSAPNAPPGKLYMGRCAGKKEEIREIDIERKTQEGAGKEIS